MIKLLRSVGQKGLFSTFRPIVINLDTHIPLIINYFVRFFLLKLNRYLFSLHKLTNRIQFLRFDFLFDASSQSIFREDYVASFSFLTFLDRIQDVQVILYCVLALKLKDKAVLQFIRLLLLDQRGLLELQLGVGLIDLLHYHFKTFRRHHDRLLDLVVLLGFVIDGKIIVDLVFLLFEELLKMFIIFCPQRDDHSSLPFFVAFLAIDTIVVFFLDPDHLEVS